MNKSIKFLFTTILLLSFTNNANAQFWKKLKKKAEDAVINKTDKELNDVLNRKKKKKEGTPQNEKKTTTKNDTSTTQVPSEKKEKTSIVSTELYRNFKFIPGEKVIFYDDLKFEETGEFPSKWDLLKGGAEIAKLNKNKVIIPTTEEINVINPLFDTQNYLEDEFTIEFDIYFDNLTDNYDEQDFGIYFYADENEFDGVRSSLGGFSNADIEFNIDNKGLNGKVYKDLTKSYDKFPLEKIEKNNIELNKWQHISVSYYKKKLKVYFNNKRVANLPNFKKTVNSFAIKLKKPVDYTDKNVSLGKNTLKTAVKNIRIAHGGGQMYKRIVADGKYVTNGILFDSGKASIQPKSMGVINKMVSIMNENPDWKFEIVGHTDSDGDETSNLKLSKERAESVKKAITEQGINTERLHATGKGESAPLNNNKNDIEKANNRRVEFIKK